MQKTKKIKKFVPILAIVLMGMVFTAAVKNMGQPLSADTILRYTPENEILAAGILPALKKNEKVQMVGSCIFSSFCYWW